MAEETPYIPPGAEEPESDVLGKLDNLLNRHKPRARDEESGAVPVLTEALPAETDDDIPTLTDIVTAGSRPAQPQDGGLESMLVQRLSLRLEAERGRLLAEGLDADRAALLDELLAGLRDTLPNIVRAALERQQRR